MTSIRTGRHRDATAVRDRALLAIVCALPRVAYLYVFGLAAGSDYYWQMGDSLLRRHELIYRETLTTKFEPLYPAFLATARWLTGDHVTLVTLLQIGVGCAGCVLLYDIAWSMSRRRSAAIIASLCYAFYPYLIRQSIAWIEITMLSTLLLASCRYYLKLIDPAERVGDAMPGIGAAARCGVALGLAILTRAMVLPILAGAVILLARRRQIRDAAIVAAIGGVLAGVGAVRIYGVNGSLLPTRSGENLFVGNCLYSSSMIPRYDLDLLPDYGATIARQRLGLSPSDTPPPGALDRTLTREALAFMVSHPLRTVRLKIVNLFYFFDVRLIPLEPMGPDTTIDLLPDGQVRVTAPRIRSTVASLAHSVVYGAILTAALLSVYFRRRRYREDELVLCTIGTFTLVSIVYFPTTRMRSPIDPLLMAYAACGVTWVKARLGRPRTLSADLAANPSC